MASKQDKIDKIVLKIADEIYDNVISDITEKMSHHPELGGLFEFSEDKDYETFEKIKGVIVNKLAGKMVKP